MGNTHDTEIARIEADFIHTKWRTTEDYRWGYTSDRGPETWWIYYPSASGGNQSPVDIQTEEVTFDPDLCQCPLHVSYAPHAAFVDADRNPTGPASTTATGPGASGAAAGSTTTTAASDDEKGSDGGLLLSPGHSCVGTVGLGGCGSICRGTVSLESCKIINTGNTVRVDLSQSRSYITGGPCRSHSYVLDHISIHWGEDDSNGSEHLVNSQPAAAEVHLVHWNEDLYDSYEDAAKREDGLIIFAVLVQVSNEKTNKALANIAGSLEDIVYRAQSAYLATNFDLSSILPDDISRYWTYRGSLTTPPCFETVTWIVFHDSIYISSYHLCKFRQLRSYGDTETRPLDDDFDGRIGRNYRPQQPIGTRKIYTVENGARGHHDLGHFDSLPCVADSGVVRTRRLFMEDPFRLRAGGGPGGAMSAFTPCRLQHVAFRRETAVSGGTRFGRGLRSRRA